MAAVNPLIDLRILPRDTHPEIMDLYLTNGTRSIPILIAFDGDGSELFRWGPRPAPAAELIARLKGTMPREDMYTQLHTWYAKNRGAAIEAEITALLEDVVARQRAVGH